MAFLLSGSLNWNAFLNVVKADLWAQDAILMAFSQDRAVLDYFRYDEAFLRRTDQGRIFSLDGELKWRLIGDQIHSVYLGESALLQELEDCSHELDGLNAQIRKLILWGVRTDLEKEWIEQQVPRRFVYPISGKVFQRGRVNLVAEDWVDSSGVPRFSRYRGLEERAGGPDA